MITTVLLSITDHWMYKTNSNIFDFLQCNQYFWGMWDAQSNRNQILLVILVKLQHDNYTTSNGICP